MTGALTLARVRIVRPVIAGGRVRDRRFRVVRDGVNDLVE
jgi:hypothetical protein